MKPKLVAIQSPKEGEEGGWVYFVLRMYSKRERKQGDSVPYTVKISSVAVVDQIRCCEYVDHLS